MNPAIRRSTETLKQYRERLRQERAEGKNKSYRVLWDSMCRGTYVRSKHGLLR